MKYPIFTLGIAAFSIAACSIKETDIDTPSVNDGEIFFASIESAPTKVYVDENLHVLWHANDRVSIFNKNSYNQQYKFIGETGDNSGEFNKVEDESFVTGNAISNIVSVYPYNESTVIKNNGTLSVKLPANQKYARNAFGVGANTMTAVSSDKYLEFKNVGGYMILRLFGEDMAVSSISLKGNNGEKLAGWASISFSEAGLPGVVFQNDATGAITLNCSSPVLLGSSAELATEFWMVVPPVSFTKGFTITVTGPDGSVYEKSTSNEQVIVRNTICRMAAVQVELTKVTTVPPEAVDLGLPSGIKWASMNVGARAPEEYGDYYAWGETQVKQAYSWENYSWAELSGENVTISKYNKDVAPATYDGIPVLEGGDDVSHVKLGRKWRLPTHTEFDELISYCRWSWTTEDGVQGYRVYSKTNGNSIFLPAAGRVNDSSLDGEGFMGNYWSSSYEKEGNTSSAYMLDFDSGSIDRNTKGRRLGLTTRPVLNEFIRNDDQAVRAVRALYNEYYQEKLYGRELYWEQACANDMVWGRTRSYSTLATLHYTGDESPLRSVFNAVYYSPSKYNQNLLRANRLIRTLLERKETDGLTDIQTRVLGEAYFFRAAYHFIIAYRYGTADMGVPFVALEDSGDSEEQQIPDQLPSVMDNYAQIISDFTKAEALLPRYESYGEQDLGRAHKAAACAMMAKVYAYWAMWDSSKWTDVITCVNRLEQSYNRGLVENYSDLFSPERNVGFWNQEYCWGIPGEGGDYKGYEYDNYVQYSFDIQHGVELPGVMLDNKGWGKFNGWGQMKPSYDLYEEMAKDNVNGNKNIRLATTILEYNDEFQYFGENRRFYSSADVETGFQCNKYMQAFAPADPIGRGYVLNNADWPVTSVMWPIVRFADALLLRAEANLAQGNATAAATDINRIRRRSKLTEIGSTATWADLYHERRCELAFEFAADHAFDCKRWAVSGAPEIKELALAELNHHPRVRHYEDRCNPSSAFTVGPYEDYKTPAKVWNEKYLTFPYPSSAIEQSNNRLQNPASWR